MRSALNWITPGPAPRYGLLRPYLQFDEDDKDFTEAVTELQKLYHRAAPRDICAAHRPEAEDDQVEISE